MPVPFFNTNGDVTALDVGGKRMCALSSMGELTCYNFDTRTTSSPPARDQGEVVVDVKVGARHGCWLNSMGGVKCWGFLDELLTPPANVTFTAISVGAATACGIATTGELHCWGESPMIFGPAGDDFVHVSVGDAAACALRQDQSVVCWGDPRIVNETPDASRRFATVEVGAQGACGIFAGGDIHCWGRGDSHRVADPSSNHSVAELVAGRAHVCARTEANEVSCWGGTSNEATDLPPGARPLTIAAGNDYTCYYDDSLDELAHTDRSIYCFSDNFSGDYIRIGLDGDPNYPQVPLRPETLVSGRSHSCAIEPGGQVHCWGDDTFGQSSPPDAPNTEFASLVAGEDFTCAIDEYGRYTCWGAFVMPLR
ncbi:unnamed protein product [Laminaria digitata]